MTEKNDSGSKLVLAIVYEKDPDSDWIVVSIPAVPGTLSQGRSREEARANILDALALMLSPEPPEVGGERERELLRLAVDGALPGARSPRADLGGRYVLVEELEGEGVVLTPDRAGPISLTDTRFSAMQERSGARDATPEEWEQLADEKARQYFGISAVEFARRLKTGEMDVDDDPNGMRVAMLLGPIAEDCPKRKD
jgi:predicted RNase H-like HicB family nuclease